MDEKLRKNFPQIFVPQRMGTGKTMEMWSEVNAARTKGKKVLILDCKEIDEETKLKNYFKNNLIMKEDFVTNPVILGDWKPKFYWTGNFVEDAERINRPHIKQEGEKEDRIKETLDLLKDLKGFDSFTIEDVFNIQNTLLKHNNWRGVKSGFREHNVSFNGTPDFSEVKILTEQLFPVKPMNKQTLLEWYRQIQIIHPLSDLNGRVFGIIVSILNDIRISKNIE